MAFDIYQQVFDRDGVPVEKKAWAYIDQLMELFIQSPEGQRLGSEGNRAWLGQYDDGLWHELSQRHPARHVT
jgi:hypothetical protein